MVPPMEPTTHPMALRMALHRTQPTLARRRSLVVVSSASIRRRTLGTVEAGGAACNPGNVCVQGGCALECPAGTQDCNGACVVLAHDPMHCGSCTNACGPDEYCATGLCRAAPVDAGVCSLPRRVCGGVCVDPSNDNANCGYCNFVCPADRLCTGGTCECTGGRSSCGEVKCVDTMTNSRHCGACGVTCGTYETCAGGACVCSVGATLCDGRCTDTNIDPAHCGGCGIACAAQQVCTGGQCRGSLSSWEMFGSNARHTGENTTETATPPATTSWSFQWPPRPGEAPAPFRGVVSSDGRVFATVDRSSSDAMQVVALHASNGAKLWSYNFGDVTSVGWPAVVAGTLFVQQPRGSDQVLSTLWAFDATSGATKWTAPFESQGDRFLPPVVVGTDLYMNGGYYGGLYGFSSVNGTQKFFNNTLPQYDRWSPAFADGVVYALAGRTLSAHDPTTGVTLWKLVLSPPGVPTSTAPVIASDKALVIAPPSVVAVDLTTHAPAWTANGAYVGTPAVAGNVVFASGGSLSALDLTTGAKLWSFAGDGALSYPPVVSAGHVYVASDSHVYAVDLTTHQSVWQADVGGRLATAAGRLFVAGKTGVLTAFVLTPH